MDYSIADLRREHALRRPLAKCLTSAEVTLYFDVLDTRSSCVANALKRSGVGAGDRWTRTRLAEQP